MSPLKSEVPTESSMSIELASYSLRLVLARLTPQDCVAVLKATGICPDCGYGLVATFTKCQCPAKGSPT
jgi:hypothetical protein